MNNYLNIIKSKIQQKIKLESIEIVDNTHFHRGHKFFSPDKLHLHIRIKSTYLHSLTRINAQKMIMKILKDDLKTKIHALEISISQ